jgi:translation elongation factor EF-1alpha
MEEKKIGKVVKYFSHVEAAVIEISEGELKVGDKIAIRGHTTNLEQEVESMQIELDAIEVAKKGDSVGIKVKERVRPHDTVYKIIA